MVKETKPIVQYINFEELELPEKIYKYRTWTDLYHKTILTNQIVYMSSPFDFEDIKDCKSLKRFDLLTNKEIYDHYLQYSKKNNTKRTREQHRKYAREWFKKSPMRNHEWIQERQEEDLKEFAERFGVLSLTTNPKSHPMWIKYGDNHKGICVGFNPKLMFPYLGGGGKVEYFDELPIIFHSDDFDIEINKQIFSKERKWEFEEEYRTNKHFFKKASPEERQIVLPKECFIEVIFGFYTPVKIKEEIRAICMNKGLNVEFMQVFSIENDEIKIKPIANN